MNTPVYFYRDIKDSVKTPSPVYGKKAFDFLLNEPLRIPPGGVGVVKTRMLIIGHGSYIEDMELVFSPNQLFNMTFSCVVMDLETDNEGYINFYIKNVSKYPQILPKGMHYGSIAIDLSEMELEPPLVELRMRETIDTLLSRSVPGSEDPRRRYTLYTTVLKGPEFLGWVARDFLESIDGHMTFGVNQDIIQFLKEVGYPPNMPYSDEVDHSLISSGLHTSFSPMEKSMILNKKNPSEGWSSNVWTNGVKNEGMNVPECGTPAPPPPPTPSIKRQSQFTDGWFVKKDVEESDCA